MLNNIVGSQMDKTVQQYRVKINKFQF